MGVTGGKDVSPLGFTHHDDFADLGHGCECGHTVGGNGFTTEVEVLFRNGCTHAFAHTASKKDEGDGVVRDCCCCCCVDLLVWLVV